MDYSNTNGVFPPGHDQGDLVSERGTALPGYTPEDLRAIIDKFERAGVELSNAKGLLLGRRDRLSELMRVAS